MNLHDHEHKGGEPDWVAAHETCLMLRGVSVPLMYHLPSGRRRVFYIDDEDEELVDAELGKAETLKQALELAHKLG